VCVNNRQVDASEQQPADDERRKEHDDVIAPAHLNDRREQVADELEVTSRHLATDHHRLARLLHQSTTRRRPVWNAVDVACPLALQKFVNLISPALFFAFFVLVFSRFSRYILYAIVCRSVCLTCLFCLAIRC